MKPNKQKNFSFFKIDRVRTKGKTFNSVIGRVKVRKREIGRIEKLKFLIGNLKNGVQFPFEIIFVTAEEVKKLPE